MLKWIIVDGCLITKKKTQMNSSSVMMNLLLLDYFSQPCSLVFFAAVLFLSFKTNIFFWIVKSMSHQVTNSSSRLHDTLYGSICYRFCQQSDIDFTIYFFPETSVSLALMNRPKFEPTISLDLSLLFALLLSSTNKISKRITDQRISRHESFRRETSKKEKKLINHWKIHWRTHVYHDERIFRSQNECTGKSNMIEETWTVHKRETLCTMSAPECQLRNRTEH